MDSPTISFRAGMSRDLRRRGLRGNSIAVSFDGGSLTVAGDTFGRIEIGLARLSRLRVGVAQSRSATFHQIAIWSAETGAPLVVGTSEPTERARFAALVRALCDAVLRGGHEARLEVGESRIRAGFLLGLFGLQAGVVATIVQLVLGESEEVLGAPPAIAVALPVVFLLGALAGLWWTWTRLWPHRVRAASDLDRVLPRAR